MFTAFIDSRRYLLKRKYAHYYANAWQVIPGVSYSMLARHESLPLSDRTNFIFFRGKLETKDADTDGRETRNPLVLRQTLKT